MNPLSETEKDTASQDSFHRFIILGNKKFYKHELMAAFGGTMQTEPYKPQEPLNFGNPAALCLASFPLSTFVLGLLADGKSVGLCFFYGGFVEAAAGIWELVLGTPSLQTCWSFSDWVFGCLSVLYMSKLLASYACGDDSQQLADALSFYLGGWAIFCFLMLCTLKFIVVFMSLFLTLDITFFLLAGSSFTGSATLQMIGAANKQNSYFTANSILIPLFGKK
ncbi:hypothetical protein METBISCDRAFT_32234 [Metschnikowia bicuspidata]|uniref:GPR1/FUN34/YaaH-class plasma membrane protein n=1 Tax=Metschnikowia bicuspidata TaxID=27322 RepID=A0A4P9Z7G7_9ASCO|nr:hypothetical protein METBISCDRAFT_32234 [Metschnikowia bicuspidata]